jgi:hypothetical protein
LVRFERRERASKVRVVKVTAALELVMARG